MSQYKNIILSFVILCLFLSVPILSTPKFTNPTTAKISYFSGGACATALPYYEYYYNLEADQCSTETCKTIFEGLFSIKQCNAFYPNKFTNFDGFMIHTCTENCGSETHVERFETNKCLNLYSENQSFKYVCGDKYAYKLSYSGLSCGTLIQNDTYTIGACNGYNYIDCSHYKASMAYISTYSPFIIGVIAFMLMLF